MQFFNKDMFNKCDIKHKCLQYNKAILPVYILTVREFLLLL